MGTGKGIPDRHLPVGTGYIQEILGLFQNTVCKLKTSRTAYPRLCVRFLKYTVFAKNGKGLFSVQSENSANFHFGQVILAKNGTAKNKTAAIIHRLSYVAVVAEDFII